MTSRRNHPYNLNAMNQLQFLSNDKRPTSRLPKGRAGRKDRHGRLAPRRVDNVQIQPDDLRILELLDRHRLATSRQLLLTVAGERNERAFLHRLRRLFDGEIVARPRQQVRPGEPARHMVYALGINGHCILHPEQWKGPHATPPRDWRQKDRRIRAQAIDHEIALTEVLLAFRLAIEAQHWSFRWSTGDGFREETGFPRAVRIESDYAGPFTLPLNPDAFITIDTGEHRTHWFLEIDMSTEPHERRDLNRSSLRQKMLAYWQLHVDTLRSYDRRRDTFRVLFVTTTAARLHNMRAAAQEVDPKKKGSHFFLFSTHDRCTLDNPDAMLTDPVWWTAKGGYGNPRCLFLPTCFECHQLVDPSNEPHVLVTRDRHLSVAPASTLLPDVMPDESQYAHADCPGLRTRL